MSWVSDRFQLLGKLSRQPFVRLLLIFWAASGAWDLALSEWIPEDYAKRLPRVYQVIAMTTGLLSWQIWIVAGALIFAFAGLEYAFRRTRGPAHPQPQSNRDLPGSITPPPAKPTPTQTPPRGAILRSDAEALVPALRSIYAILYESVRDSTTMLGPFTPFKQHRLSMPSKVDAAILLEAINVINDFYFRLRRDLAVIYNRNIAFRNQLPPFLGSMFESRSLVDNLSQLSILLKAIAQTDHLDVGTIVNTYIEKIVAEINRDYQTRANDIRLIERKIEEITNYL
jgi:hypothetical protein